MEILGDFSTSVSGFSNSDFLKNIPYVSRSNLRVLMGDNRRTLDYRIASLITQKKLLPLKSGVYLSLPYYATTAQPSRMLEYLASVLVSPSYISLEYILSQYGLIPESVAGITSITTKKTRCIANAVGSFTYRNIKNDLYTGFTIRTFEDKQYYVAKPAKALFDFIYLTRFPSKLAMKQYLLEDARLNWDALSPADVAEFMGIVLRSSSAKMRYSVKVITEHCL